MEESKKEQNVLDETIYNLGASSSIWSFSPFMCGNHLVSMRLITIELKPEGQRLYHSSRAHTCGAKLLRFLVQILPGAWLFSILLCLTNSASFIQVPQGGAILLIFL